MSICNVKDCGSDYNVWKVSNDNKSPPLYQDFYLCNRHLNLDRRVKKVHKALVLGRLNNQLSDNVSHDGWHLEKMITTWKKDANPNWKCSDCSTTGKIWIVVKPEPAEEEDQVDEYSEFETTSFFCDWHLPRFEFSDDPKIRSWNSDVGISTLEDTWTEEQFHSSNKRSLLQKGSSNPSVKKKMKE